MTRANISNVSNQDDFKWNMTLNGRLPSILKVEYLSNYWSDLSQILTQGFYDQSIHFKCFKWRWLQMEDDLKWNNTSSINGGISQHLLVQSFPSYKLKLIWPKQIFQRKTFSDRICFHFSSSSNGRLPQILKL